MPDNGELVVSLYLSIVLSIVDRFVDILLLNSKYFCCSPTLRLLLICVMYSVFIFSIFNLFFVILIDAFMGMFVYVLVTSHELNVVFTFLFIFYELCRIFDTAFVIYNIKVYIKNVTFTTCECFLKLISCIDCQFCVILLGFSVLMV